MTAIRYSGGQIVEKAEMQGNLLSLYEHSLQFVKRYSDLLKFKPKKLKQHNSPIHQRGALSYLFDSRSDCQRADAPRSGFARNEYADFDL